MLNVLSKLAAASTLAQVVPEMPDHLPVVAESTPDWQAPGKLILGGLALLVFIIIFGLVIWRKRRRAYRYRS